MSAKKSGTSSSRSKQTGRKPTTRKTNASPKQGEAAYPKKGKRKRMTLYIVLGLAVLFSGAAAWQHYFGAAAQVQSMMSNHLRDRYGKEFHVDRPHVVIKGFGVPTVYEAKAYPVDSPSITFRIESRRDRVGTDQYVGASWQQDANDYVRPIIKRHFNYSPDYTLGVSTYQTPDSPLGGDFPSFTEALETHKSQVGVTIKINAREQITDNDKRLVAERVLGVVEELSPKMAYVRVEYKGSTGGGLSYSVGSAPYIKDHPSINKSVEELTNDVAEGK